MEPLLVGVTLFSLALALTMTVVAWRLLRHARDREDARTEALRARAFEQARSADEHGLEQAPGARGLAASVRTDDDPAEDARRDWDLALTSHTDVSQGARADHGGNVDSSDTDEDRSPMFAPAAAPTHTRWLAFAAVALVMIAAVVTVSALHSPEMIAAVAASHSAAAASDAQALQLLSLRQDVDPDGGFTVTGLVENPRGGEPLGRVQAVVYLFDASGRYFASGRANLEVNTFAPGDESPFVVRIPSASGVSRYRVGFRKDDGSVVAHVDRRGQMPTGTTGDAIDAAAPRPAVPLGSSSARIGDPE